MSNDELQIKVNKFKSAAEHIFNTPSGIEVLTYLKDDYVERTAIAESVELTYYRLGQKELIQSLIQLVNESEQLDELTVSSGITDHEI